MLTRYVNAICLLAHVKQQAIVNVVNAKHSNNNGGIYDNMFVALNILKQENHADD
jgi:hypothetical protein